MARKRTGALVRRKNGFSALVTVTVDGEAVRKWFPLGTDNTQAAKRKLARLVAKLAAGETLTAELVGQAEFFSEACERVMKQRIADGVVSAPDQKARLKKFALPDVGHLEVTKVTTPHINETLDVCKRAGMSRQTIQHLKQAIRTVFAALKREGAITINPVDDAELPTMPVEGVKERETVQDAELAKYLAYEHPQEHWRMAVLECQTMACVSRMFGGLRTGDLHKLKWEIFDTDETGSPVSEPGAFLFGWAPRKKTKRPQLLEVPSLLRPIIRDWWERNGRPTSGLIFASRRGVRVGEEKKHVSHARRLRRDLRRAFGIEKWNPAKNKFEPAREPTARERALLEGTEYTERVDFHSFRRAYSQGLADADVNVQTATALAGHASLAAHARYLLSTGKMRSAPEAALPKIAISNRLLLLDTASAAPVSESSMITAGRTGLEPAASGVTGAHPIESAALSPHNATPGSAPGAPDITGLDDSLLLPVTIGRPWFLSLDQYGPALVDAALALPDGALDNLCLRVAQ